MLQARDALDGGKGRNAHLDGMAGGQLLQDSRGQANRRSYVGTWRTLLLRGVIHPRQYRFNGVASNGG